MILLMSIYFWWNLSGERCILDTGQWKRIQYLALIIMVTWWTATLWLSQPQTTVCRPSNGEGWSVCENAVCSSLCVCWVQYDPSACACVCTLSRWCDGDRLCCELLVEIPSVCFRGNLWLERRDQLWKQGRTGTYWHIWAVNHTLPTVLATLKQSMSLGSALNSFQLTQGVSAQSWMQLSEDRGHKQDITFFS